ncbi:MAG: PKD domain-containing protein [Gemmatimonadales bacterium]
MRLIRMLAAVGTLSLASACGGDGGGTPPPDNEPPVAGFSEVCTQLSCVFTDTSTDPEGSNTITARSWNFGDNTPLSTETNPTHVYAADGTYTVVLTVTDNAGAQDDFSKPVTVTGGTPGNISPTASFDLPADCTAGTPCGFHSTSTDPDGVIASALWNFGDGETAEGLDATHTYAAAGTYDVTLTVTDDDGATANATQQLTVSPAASQDCTTSGTVVNCSLTITQQATVKITITSVACELTGNRLSVSSPIAQTVFFNLCNRTVGEEYTIMDGAGGTLVFGAGSQLGLRFDQGTPGPGDPATSDPGIRITGSYPNWTLNIDDGGAAGAEGEPDFDDVVLSVQATPSP